MSVTEVFRGDNGALIINGSDMDLGPIAAAVGDTAPTPEQAQIMGAMASWVGNQNANRRKLQGIFDRDSYLLPNSTFEKIRVARLAAKRDDIIGRAVRLTESLAFKHTEVRCADLDQKDVWNQIAADLNLDARLREIWRVLFTDSQVVVATWWGRKSYKSRRKTKAGQQSRKGYDLTVPLAMSLIDTTRVTPIGPLMFNQERLAFIANPLEADYLDAMLAARDGLTPPAPRDRAGRTTTTVYNEAGQRLLAPTVPETGITMVDPIVARLITSRYTPDRIEEEQLRADGVDPTHLFAFDPRFVFRHTKTRPQFQRFADVDLEPAFELLDLKHQLRAVDRAHLIGGANYIVLVTKGSDKQPAAQPEIDNLRAHVRTLGSVPVLVGDHRLNVEIVTPSQDTVLSQEKHDVLDVRLTAHVYGMFASTGKGNDDPLKAGRVIASGLESERLMVRRAIEAEIFQLIRDANDDLTDRAKLTFLPGTISLIFDSSWATFLLDMRESRLLSRDTLQSQFGFDQADEALLMEMEAVEYDQIFKEIVPHGVNPGKDDGDHQALGPGEDQGAKRLQQRRAGRRQGGNNNGGGRAPGTRQGQESIDPRRSKTGPTRKPRADVVAAVASVANIAEDADFDTVAAALRTLERDELIAVATEVDDPVKRRHRLKVNELVDALLTLAADTDEDHD